MHACIQKYRLHTLTNTEHAYKQIQMQDFTNMKSRSWWSKCTHPRSWWSKCTHARKNIFHVHYSQHTHTHTHTSIIHKCRNIHTYTCIHTRTDQRLGEYTYLHAYVHVCNTHKCRAHVCCVCTGDLSAEVHTDKHVSVHTMHSYAPYIFAHTYRCMHTDM
jgi:hypothetical protein